MNLPTISTRSVWVFITTSLADEHQGTLVLMRNPVLRRPPNHPHICADRLFQAGQTTVPARRGIPGFEDPLPPAIEDLQMIVCCAPRKFKAEDIVNAVSVRSEGIGEPDFLPRDLLPVAWLESAPTHHFSSTTSTR